jgi:raffinose/stachyose/melibiose transport system substrate-binding protein
VPHVEETTKVRGRLRHTRIFAGIAAAALALSACAPDASETADTGGATDTTPTEAASGISKEFPSDVPINLTLASWEVGGLQESIEAIIDAFEAKHPNVTITTEYASFGDYGQRIKLQMTGDDAPDIAQAGQAFTMMGPLVEAGLLRPLDDYAELYGWADRFGPGLLDQARFEPDGSKFGTGNLYGLAKGGNMVGIFFNRTIIEDLGVSVPFNTMADFQAALDAAKAKGYIPMALGNSEQWPANHTLSVLISQYCDNAEMLSWIYGNDGADFTAPCFLEATSVMENWADNGLIDPAANGLSFDDGINRFAEGKSAFFVTGNWALPTMADKMGDNVGFTGFPGAAAGAPARATGATTSPFTISAKTEWPDVAAAFIDFMTGPETYELRANGGYAPLLTDVEIAESTQLINEYNAVWARVIKDDGLTLFLDWSTVGMGNVLFPAIQEMIANRLSAQDLVTQVQAEWETGRS